jgi:hypothetical protein
MCPTAGQDRFAVLDLRLSVSICGQKTPTTGVWDALGREGVRSAQASQHRARLPAPPASSFARCAMEDRMEDRSAVALRLPPSPTENGMAGQVGGQGDTCSLAPKLLVTDRASFGTDHGTDPTSKIPNVYAVRYGCTDPRGVKGGGGGQLAKRRRGRHRAQTGPNNA